jgi:hypothetical protein
MQGQVKTIATSSNNRFIHLASIALCCEGEGVGRRERLDSDWLKCSQGQAILDSIRRDHLERVK